MEPHTADRAARRLWHRQHSLYPRHPRLSGELKDGILEVSGRRPADLLRALQPVCTSDTLQPNLCQLARMQPIAPVGFAGGQMAASIITRSVGPSATSAIRTSSDIRNASENAIHPQPRQCPPFGGTLH